MAQQITIGVLALQGAFTEHMQLLRQAFKELESWSDEDQWSCVEVRTEVDLNKCDALIIPGGESTAISLVAARSGLLEALRSFVKVDRRPTWGTCAGLILLAEAANRTKQGGQELIGGLDVRVNRNHFGRQFESFQADLDLPCLISTSTTGMNVPFRATFIRSPIVEKILPRKAGIQDEEMRKAGTVVAPSQKPKIASAAVTAGSEVEVLGKLPARRSQEDLGSIQDGNQAENIVAVKQGNVFGTSFHPELTGDARIHMWWLVQARESIRQRRENQ